MPAGSATIVWVSLEPDGVTYMPRDSMLSQSRITRSSDLFSRRPSLFESTIVKPFHTSRPLNWSLHSDSPGRRRKSFGTLAFW